MTTHLRCFAAARAALGVLRTVLLVVIPLIYMETKAVEPQKAGWWLGVSRVRGHVSMEHLESRNDQDGDRHYVDQQSVLVDVDFTMERRPLSESRDSATWEADFCRINGVLIRTIDHAWPWFEARSTTTAEFNGPASSLSESRLVLNADTGVWQLNTPRRMQQKYRVVTSGVEHNTGSNEDRDLSEESDSDDAYLLVFDGTTAGTPGPVHGSVKRKQGGYSGNPTSRTSSTGELQFWPEYDDVELEITIDGYAKWRPEGSIGRPTSPGNHLVARGTLKPKGKGSVEDLPKVKSIRFKLLDTSSEPGICLNWPLAAKDSDFDLRLAVAPPFVGRLTNRDQLNEVEDTLSDEKGRPYAETQIDSYDFGGRASLQVIAELADGRMVVGLMKSDAGEENLVRVPRMKGPDWIAQSWREEKEVEHLPAVDDEEKVDGQPMNGDGFTLYEEYRGWVIDGKHLSGDPKKKELFVFNDIGADAVGGLKLFEDRSKIRVHHQGIRNDEMPMTRIMNGNRRDGPHHSGVYQHGVVMITPKFPFAGGTGKGGGKTYAVKNDDVRYAFRPATADHIEIEARNLTYGTFSHDNSTQRYNLSERDASVAFDRAVAHELLHAVGVDHHGEYEGSSEYYFQSASDPNNPTHRAGFSERIPWITEYDLQSVPFGRRKDLRDLDRGETTTLIWEDGRDVAESMAADFERALEAKRAARAAGKEAAPPEDPGARATKYPNFGKDAWYWRETEIFDSVVMGNGPTGRSFSLMVVDSGDGEADSGDELCLMRYYFANAYPIPNRKNAFYLVRPEAGANRAGREICRSPAGTLHNAASHTPKSRFGDAHSGRGNCFAQICPNDSIPPRKL